MRLLGVQKNVDGVDIVDNNKIFSKKYLEKAIPCDKLRQKIIHSKIKKYPQKRSGKKQPISVDNVDN